MRLQVPAPVVGGAYITLADDSKLVYRVDPGGETLEFVVLGPMELGIGMSPTVLQRCQELFAEALLEVRRAQQETENDRS